jgi:bifunctional non-homologous end joining protein LigD
MAAEVLPPWLECASSMTIHDWTERFPLIFEALSTLKVTTCLLDGEAVTCNETGLAEFDGLRGRRGDVHLCAFDLLELDGRGSRRL